ncbi:glycosyltransferase family 39 protein [Brevibacterium sp. 50QC2O2]|uniref:glycosyltransferase family 39 protein n=1 Tax=Brevibacterium sp. 50QC2O2 TaxID=2968459 RepID=UPI00211CA88C|nr:glycosyltransferase family 39 protein [Brevibacterium sp. 50QC2O2]MCQ9389372.1 glycosyltransferase family 39 protein [Brevibacterium sp. 50QC2O2]
MTIGKKTIETKKLWLNLGVVAMLLLAALVYLWNLTVSGYGNAFYAAVVRAGSQDWTALLFGSLDAANGITVDKPPAAYWIPALFARIFGFSSFTVLFPQAVMGVATVWLVYCTVARTSGRAWGLLAGLLMTLSPVAVMMFRFDNPDAMLTLCLTLAAYLTVRAIQSPRRADWWMLGCGLIIGLAFLTKMLQGFMTLPALGLAFLIAAPGGWLRRLRGLAVGVAGLIVPVVAYAGVFYAWPADERPYMAGTEGNDFWELVFGYNGLGRIFGGSGNGGGGMGGQSSDGNLVTKLFSLGLGGSNTGFGGSTGILRLFNTGFGPEIAWLLPTAVILLVAGLIATRRAVRTDPSRAALIVWGGWLLVTVGVFSYMEGTIHPYYVVVLAPAIAGLTAVGAQAVLARIQDDDRASATAGGEASHGHHAAAGGRGSRAFWYRAGLGAAVAAGGASAYYLLAVNGATWLPWLRWVLLIGSLLAAIAITVGLDQLRIAGFKHIGAVVLTAALVFGAGGTAAWSLASVGNAYTGSIPASGPAVAGTGTGGGMGGGMGGGPGGAGGQSQSELVDLLQQTTTTYSAAMSGATSAAELMISSDTEVLDIGGWNGSDSFPTLDEFKQLVADGEIAYYISGGQGGGPGGGNDEIAAWVADNYSSTTVGGSTVYDLTQAKS